MNCMLKYRYALFYLITIITEADCLHQETDNEFSCGRLQSPGQSIQFSSLRSSPQTIRAPVHRV